jgi:hypothetical protein
MLMQFKDGATEAQIEAALEGLATMPDRVPGILRYEFGSDLGLIDGNPDLALVADFTSAEDWRAYLDHPDHRALVESVIAPIMGAMTRVQYLVE